MSSLNREIQSAIRAKMKELRAERREIDVQLKQLEAAKSALNGTALTKSARNMGISETDVFDRLDPRQPKSIGELASELECSNMTVTRRLRNMVDKGTAREITGGSRFQKYVRKNFRIKPGSGVED